MKKKKNNSLAIITLYHPLLIYRPISFHLSEITIYNKFHTIQSRKLNVLRVLPFEFFLNFSTLSKNYILNLSNSINFTPNSLEFPNKERNFFQTIPFHRDEIHPPKSFERNASLSSADDHRSAHFLPIRNFAATYSFPSEPRG